MCWCGRRLQIRPRPLGAGTGPRGARGWGWRGYSEPLARGARSASSPKADRRAAPRRAGAAEHQEESLQGPGEWGRRRKGRKEPQDPALRSEFVQPPWRPGGGCPPLTAAAGASGHPEEWDSGSGARRELLQAGLEAGEELLPRAVAWALIVCGNSADPLGKD